MLNLVDSAGDLARRVDAGTAGVVRLGFTAVSAISVSADAVPVTPTAPGATTPASGSVALPGGTLPATGAPELPSTWTGLRLILLGALALAMAAHLRRREQI